MDGIIDFHTHAFPDALADRAMAALSAEVPNVAYYLDGRISSLLKSMNAAGIERSVLCSIATRPSQFEPIFEWSKQIRSDRIIPFPSIHPDDPNLDISISRIADEGFKGIKMHPYYQSFSMTEPRLYRTYELLSRHHLILVMHTGFDIAFERVRRADPAMILQVLKDFPELKLVTTHVGGWEQWDEVDSELIGKPVYMDISFTEGYLSPDKMRQMLCSHPDSYLLFGTDSPWDDQNRAVQRIAQLKLKKEFEKKVFRLNALELLGLNN
ncbi:MAG: amidohydrolase family protein [Sedimentisphaerales bacterium]|nr:amidohydrolase family protein [Sedimentisphaerales bacterium]